MRTSVGKTLLILLGLLLPHMARADGPTATQEEVFKSISNNENESVDGKKVVAVLIAGAAVAMLGVIYNRRQSRAATPVKLNHQGKLMKELIKRGGLTRSQAKQLRTRADAFAAAGDPLESPITLVLCPSLLGRRRE